MKRTEIISTVSRWREIRPAFQSLTVGFIPTMGALHEGHLELVKKSKLENDVTVVSIFVNPTQFDDPKDLEKYPRPLDEDLAKLTSADVDYLFNPSYEELYPDDFRYLVDEKELS